MAHSTERLHVIHLQELEKQFVERINKELAGERARSTTETIEKYIAETTLLNAATAKTLSKMNACTARDVQDRCHRIEVRLERVEIAAWIAAASAALLVLVLAGMMLFVGYNAGWFG